jgi:hypothetical protein
LDQDKKLLNNKPGQRRTCCLWDAQSGVMTSLPWWTSILTRCPGGKPACSSHMPAMRSHGKNVGVRHGRPGFGLGRQRKIFYTVAWRSG